MDELVGQLDALEIGDKGYGRRPPAPLMFEDITIDTYPYKKVSDEVNSALEKAKKNAKPSGTGSKADCEICGAKNLSNDRTPSGGNSGLYSHIKMFHKKVFQVPVYCGCDGGGDESKLGKCGRFAKDIPPEERGKFEVWENLRNHLKGQNKPGNIHNPNLVGFRPLPPVVLPAATRRFTPCVPCVEEPKPLLTPSEENLDYNESLKFVVKNDYEFKAIDGAEEYLEEMESSIGEPLEDSDESRAKAKRIVCRFCPEKKPFLHNGRTSSSLTTHIQRLHIDVFKTPVFCGCNGGTDGVNGKSGNFQTGRRAKPYTTWSRLFVHLTISRIHNPARYADKDFDNEADKGSDNDADDGADNDDADVADDGADSDGDDCQHPQELRVTDHQSGDVLCSNCGLVLGQLFLFGGNSKNDSDSD